MTTRDNPSRLEVERTSPGDLSAGISRRTIGRRRTEFESDALWQQFLDLGTELWLDSGNFEEVRSVWTREFSALTTNNTLLNKEVQTGTYDDLIAEAAELLSGFEDLTEREFMLEIAFILNATHGLRLVEQFDAFVSVEEHTDLAERRGAGGRVRPAVLRDLSRAILREDPVHARRSAGDASGPAGGHPRQSHAGLLRPAELRHHAAVPTELRERLPGPAQQLHLRERSRQWRLRGRTGDPRFPAGRALAAGRAGVRNPPDRRQFPVLGAVRESGRDRRDHGAAQSRAGTARQTATSCRPWRANSARTVPRRSTTTSIRRRSDWTRSGTSTTRSFTASTHSATRISTTSTPRVCGLFRGARDAVTFLVRWSEAEIATSAEEGKIPKLAHWAESAGQPHHRARQPDEPRRSQLLHRRPEANGRSRPGGAEEDQCPALGKAAGGYWLFQAMS